LLFAKPNFCRACFLATISFVGMIAGENPFKQKWASLRWIGILLVVSFGVTVIRATLGHYKTAPQLSAGTKQDENALIGNFQEGEMVVLSLPNCDACRQASDFVQARKPKWRTLLPCDAERRSDCHQKSSGIKTFPTLVQWKDGKALVRANGFSAEVWSVLE